MPTCHQCGDTYDRGFDGQYCSHDCFYRRRGHKALNIARHDHRLCGTCLRWLKEVDETPEEWQERRRDIEQHCLENGGEYHSVDGQLALDITQVTQEHRTSADVVIGFQYLTPNAEIVEREDRRSTNDYQPVVHTGTGCKCGQTQPGETDKDLRQVELATVLTNTVRSMWHFWDEGQLDQRLDKDTFFDAFRESADLEYALGVGLHQ
jgi:hypothetical protein